MGRVSLCKYLVARTNIYSSYVSKINYYAAAAASSSSSSSSSLQGTHFRGQGRKICILVEPNPNPSQVKAGPGNLVEVGCFDREAHPTMNAPTTNAFHAITGNLKNEIKVEEAKEVLDGDMMMQTAKRTEKMAWRTRIKRGDVINLNDLLFTQNRDYLIRYNDNRQVKAEELADKVIVVYFVPLLADYLPEWVATTHLTDTYNYLLPHNVFEVVLVAYEIREQTLCSGSPTNPEKQFESIFSYMPWTAIPFSDIATRECLCRRFDICMSGSLDSFVIDSSGMVWQSNCLHLFGKYGGPGYPFSDGRIQLLESEDDAIVEQPSLEMLLASAERDYVISNKGDKVPIDTLEDKVVALYFYEEGKTPRRLTADIELAYEEFAKKKKEFEVVLIYLYDTIVTCGHTNEESFREKFNSMPWLALPFKDPTYRKLMRFFGYHLDLGEWEKTPSLVIFGPNGEFIEPWGADILMNYKLPAYPFTREKVSKLEIEKVKELKLEMLFDRNTLFRRNDGTEVPLYELAGKRIVLFFEGNKPKDHTAHFLSILKDDYPHVERMKGTDYYFEVIYITFSKEDAVYEELVWDVPWLFAHVSWLLPIDLSLYCCYCQPEPLHSVLRCSYPSGWCGSNSTLLAFDQDGRLVRKSVYLDFHPINCFDYADMEEDTLSELIKHHGWLDLDREYRGLVINSLYKWSPGLACHCV